MSRLLGVLAGLAPALAIPVAAAPDPLAAATIVAGAVDALPGSPADPAWDGLPVATASASVQRTVRLNDRDVNAALASARPVTFEIRAASTARELAIRVSWPDSTENRSDAVEPASFGDAAALEIPVRFGAGERLPYVGMGDVASPVQVYMLRAASGASAVNEYLAAGFGSLTRSARRHAAGELAYDRAARTWRAAFRRPLQAAGHDLGRGLVPIAFAVWDGAVRERGGNKRLSSWKLLRLGRFPVDAAYARELQVAYSPDKAGSAARGKQLAEATCTACHRIGGARTAPAALAPNLSAIGAIATYGYLRESIRDPGAVAVPIGREFRSSKMPSFAGLPAQDVADIVAYLKTLEGKE